MTFNLPTLSRLETALVGLGRMLRRLSGRSRDAARQDRRSMNG